MREKLQQAGYEVWITPLGPPWEDKVGVMVTDGPDVLAMFTEVGELLEKRLEETCGKLVKD